MGENEEKALKFIWRIENYSYCWNATGDSLRSPDFEMNVFEGSSWCLKLYPRGVSSYENYVSVYLERLSSSSGPLGITVDYEISLLRPDGTVEYAKETKNRCFRKGYSFGFDNLAVREHVLGLKRLILLPDDILTVQCLISPKGTQLKSHTEIIAKTHLELERYIFRWKSENCFSKRCEEFKTVRSFNGLPHFVLRLCWFSVNQIDKLFIGFSNFDRIKVFHCKFSVLVSNDSISQCILDKHIDVGEHLFHLTAVDEMQLQKCNILPNDKLTLHCDLTCSFKIQYKQIEIVVFDGTLSAAAENREMPSEIDTAAKKHSCNIKYDIHKSFKKDFATLYEEGTLSDFTLKVGNESIRAHKAVLVARSPVFKAMLTSNMKENETNAVDISGLDANTVRYMLKFMYTDTTDDLDWEVASKLYQAADKYGIVKLKRVCSDVLQRELSVSNAMATLSLASLHGDDDLKNQTIEFISNHDTEVICSTEWKDFMTEETLLAAETMREIFVRKSENERGKSK